MNPTGFKMTPQVYWRGFLCVFICVVFLKFYFMSNKNFRGSWEYLYGLECELYGSALLLIVQRGFMIFGHFLAKVAFCSHWSLPQSYLLTHSSLSLLRSLCYFNLSPMGALQSKGKSAPSGNRTNPNGGWEGIHPSCTSVLFNSLQGALGGRTYQAWFRDD